MKKILQFLFDIIRRKYIYALDVTVIYYKHKPHKQLMLLNNGDLNPLEIFKIASSVRNRTYFGFYKKQFKIQFNRLDNTISVRNKNNIPITNNGSLLKNITGYGHIYVIYNNGILPLCDLNETIVFLDLENKCLLKETYKFNLPFDKISEVLLASGMVLIMTTFKIKGRLINCIYTRRIPQKDHKAFDFPYIDIIFHLSIDKEIVATDLDINTLVPNGLTPFRNPLYSKYVGNDVIYKTDKLRHFFDEKFNKNYSYNDFLRDLLNVKFNPRKSSTWDGQDS